MYQKQTTIKADPYIDTRPAAHFVQCAKAYNAVITATVNDKSADAKSLFQLNTLDLSKGNVITVAAEGPQAQNAVDGLIRVVDEDLI